MRVSIDKNDRAYNETLARKVLSITCDGREIPMAIMADEDEGIVRAFASDAQGNAVVDPKDSSSLLVEEHSGKVVIKMADRKWDADRETSSARVRVGRMPNGTIICEVFSLARKGAARRFELPQNYLEGKTQHQVCQLVGVHAGAQMENMAERFGDRTDPSLVASVAVEQTWNMIRDEEGYTPKHDPVP